MEARGRIPQAIGSAIHFANSNNSHQYISHEVSVPMNVNFQDKFHSVTLSGLKIVLKCILIQIMNHSIQREKILLHLIMQIIHSIINFISYSMLPQEAIFDSNQLDPTKFCNNEQCTNLSEPDKGRFLIDYIEIKSID